MTSSSPAKPPRQGKTDGGNSDYFADILDILDGRTHSDTSVTKPEDKNPSSATCKTQASGGRRSSPNLWLSDTRDNSLNKAEDKKPSSAPCKTQTSAGHKSSPNLWLCDTQEEEEGEKKEKQSHDSVPKPKVEKPAWLMLSLKREKEKEGKKEEDDDLGDIFGNKPEDKGPSSATSKRLARAGRRSSLQPEVNDIREEDKEKKKEKEVVLSDVVGTKAEEKGASSTTSKRQARAARRASPKPNQFVSREDEEVEEILKEKEKEVYIPSQFPSTPDKEKPEMLTTAQRNSIQDMKAKFKDLTEGNNSEQNKKTNPVSDKVTIALRREVQELKAKLEHLSEEKNQQILQLEDKLMGAQTRNKNMWDITQKVNKELEETKASLEESNEDKDKLNEVIDDEVAENTRLKNMIKELEDKVEDAQTKKDNMWAIAGNVNKELEETKDALEESEKVIDSLHDLLDEQEGEIASLKKELEGTKGAAEGSGKGKQSPHGKLEDQEIARLKRELEETNGALEESDKLKRSFESVLQDKEAENARLQKDLEKSKSDNHVKERESGDRPREEVNSDDNPLISMIQELKNKAEDAQTRVVIGNVNRNLEEIKDTLKISKKMKSLQKMLEDQEAESARLKRELEEIKSEDHVKGSESHDHPREAVLISEQREKRSLILENEALEASVKRLTLVNQTQKRKLELGMKAYRKPLEPLKEGKNTETEDQLEDLLQQDTNVVSGEEVQSNKHRKLLAEIVSLKKLLEGSYKSREELMRLLGASDLVIHRYSCRNEEVMRLLEMSGGYHMETSSRDKEIKDLTNKNDELLQMLQESQYKLNEVMQQQRDGESVGGNKELIRSIVEVQEHDFQKEKLELQRSKMVLKNLVDQQRSELGVQQKYLVNLQSERHHLLSTLERTKQAPVVLSEKWQKEKESLETKICVLEERYKSLASTVGEKEKASMDLYKEQGSLKSKIHDLKQENKELNDLGGTVAQIVRRSCKMSESGENSYKTLEEDLKEHKCVQTYDALLSQGRQRFQELQTMYGTLKDDRENQARTVVELNKKLDILSKDYEHLKREHGLCLATSDYGEELPVTLESLGRAENRIKELQQRDEEQFQQIRELTIEKHKNRMALLTSGHSGDLGGDSVTPPGHHQQLVRPTMGGSSDTKLPAMRRLSFLEEEKQ